MHADLTVQLSALTMMSLALLKLCK